MAEVNSNRTRISTKCTAITNHHMVNTEFTWIIRNFGLCPEQQGEYITSPKFGSDQLTDVVWRLRLYPVGSDYWGYVTLMLQLESCGKEDYLYASCKFAVIDVHQKEQFAHEEKLQKFTRGSLVGPKKFCTKMQTFKPGEGEGDKKPPPITGILGKQSQVLHGSDLVIRCEVNSIRRSEMPVIATSHVKEDEISAHLSNLLESGSLSDFVITVGDVKYPVHRAVLAARSSFFLAMLEANNNGGVAQVEDVSPETVYEMLRYIYTGRVQHLEETAEDLLRLAQRYRLDGLKAQCEKTLSYSLSLENAVHLLIFADDHRALDLKNNILQLIRMHAREICRTEDWKSVARKNPHLVEEVLEALVEDDLYLKDRKSPSATNENSAR